MNDQCPFTVESLTRTSTKGRLQNWWTLAESSLAKKTGNADQIRAAMDVHRHPSTVVGVMTHEKADDLLTLSKSVPDLLISHGICMYMSDIHYFITDGCLYDVPGFTPVLQKNLLRASYKEFRSVKEACDHYAKSLYGTPLAFIPSIEALVTHLNGESSLRGDSPRPPRWHSDESLERAFQVLDDLVSSSRNTGISALMLVKEQLEFYRARGDAPLIGPETSLGSLRDARLNTRAKSTVTMYYCVRYLHNPDRPTEYYVGGGVWAKKDVDRIKVRLYEKEDMAKLVIADLPETDWFAVEIEI